MRLDEEKGSYLEGETQTHMLDRGSAAGVASVAAAVRGALIQVEKSCGLFTKTKTWKQPKFPSAGEWIKEMWYVRVCACIYI